MAWTPDTAFLEGLDFFNRVVDSIPTDGWQRPAPCTGWRALDVLGHVGSSTKFGTRLLQGERPSWEPTEPPGSAVSGNPAQWWTELVEPARAAVRNADLDEEVDTPFGRRSVADGLKFPAVDLFIHGWDLARSVGQDVEIPPDAVEFAHSVIDPLPDEQVRSPRVFAGEVAATDAATPSERFIAWTGRDPSWSPR